MAAFYGPDINTKHGDGHAVLDRAWSLGDRWVAIKAAGGNVGLYEAPRCAEQVAYARHKGFRICHYVVSGSQSIAAQVSNALDAIRPHWEDGDAVAWDNEQLDSTGAIRNDADSAAWLAGMRAKLGFPAKAGWMYGSAGSLYREHAPWPRIKASQATRWVASYPGPPSMTGTGLTWDISQYTSSYAYGDSTLTDRNVCIRQLDTVFPRNGKPQPSPKPQPVVKRYVYVQAGDTLTAIAARNGLTLSALEKLNPQIVDPNHIVPGQRVRVK